MTKQVVHDPSAVLAALRNITSKHKQEQLTIENAIACLNHLQNVVQRQRKHLANITDKDASK
jgi:hypothetical protein